MLLRLGCALDSVSYELKEAGDEDHLLLLAQRQSVTFYVLLEQQG